MTKAVSAKLMLRNFICPSMTWPDLITGPVALNAAIIAEHDEVELPRTVILRAELHRGRRHNMAQPIIAEHDEKAPRAR